MAVGSSSDADIVSSGKNDYYSHKGVYKNPYASGTIECNAYERGWMQSLKFDNGRLVELTKRPRTKPPEPRPAVNLYALAKGRSEPRK